MLKNIFHSFIHNPAISNANEWQRINLKVATLLATRFSEMRAEFGGDNDLGN